MARGSPGIGRRSLAPSSPQSLLLAAVWTGAGAVLVCAVIAVAAVALCWLPASNGAASASSAIRAGILTFLAALHGGITVDGLPAEFLPLGMAIAVGAVAWRAGRRLAEVARDVETTERRLLLTAGGVQCALFAALCAVAAHFATLGTSRVSVLAAGVAGFVLFAVSGGVAFVRGTALGGEVRAQLPDWAASGLRAAVVAASVYLAAGALLVAASLVVHHGRVEAISQQVGGGWSGAPVLLLGILAAPNAAIAAASYLAGPGFALGSGSAVGFGSSVQATLPAFPVLGAVPSGPATTSVWLLVAAVPAAAGVCMAQAARAAPTFLLRLRIVAVGAVILVLLGIVLAWQGGGSIGSGRLSAFGASPWQFALAVAGGAGTVAVAWLAALALLAWWRARAEQERAIPLVDADDVDADAAADADADDDTVAVAEAETGIVDDPHPDADEGDKLAG